MKKANKALSYNPGRADCIDQIIFAILYTAFMGYLGYELIMDPDYLVFNIFAALVTVMVDVACVYNFYKDPAAKTAITIDQNGIQISFLSGEAPAYIPWSKEVFINICVEDKYITHDQIVHRRILCLSNYDINGAYIKYEGKIHCINMLHKFPDDDNDVWVLFLVTDTTGACKRAAKRVSAFKDAALSGERDIRELI